MPGCLAHKAAEEDEKRKKNNLLWTTEFLKLLSTTYLRLNTNHAMPGGRYEEVPPSWLIIVIISIKINTAALGSVGLHGR